MFRITAIALLLTVNFDLYTGGKYTNAIQRMSSNIFQNFR